jgi:flagellin-like protein
MRLTRMIKSKKAISPIFASLILIAIAVIAGIVVYMFTSGTIGSLTTGGTAAQEKAAVQGVGGFTATNFQVYASYVDGGSAITITGAVIKAADGTTFAATSVAGGPLDVDGALVTITVTAGLTLDTTYTITLTSDEGGSFASSAFTTPAAWPTP